MMDGKQQLPPIDRYEILTGYGSAYAGLDRYGEYVLYEDHERQLREALSRIAELEAREVETPPREVSE